MNEAATHTPYIYVCGASKKNNFYLDIRMHMWYTVCIVDERTKTQTESGEDMISILIGFVIMIYMMNKKVDEKSLEKSEKLFEAFEKCVMWLYKNWNTIGYIAFAIGGIIYWPLLFGLIPTTIGMILEAFDDVMGESNDDN